MKKEQENSLPDLDSVGLRNKATKEILRDEIERLQLRGDEEYLKDEKLRFRRSKEKLDGDCSKRTFFFGLTAIAAFIFGASFIVGGVTGSKGVAVWTLLSLIAGIIGIMGFKIYNIRSWE